MTTIHCLLIGIGILILFAILKAISGSKKAAEGDEEFIALLRSSAALMQDEDDDGLPDRIREIAAHVASAADEVPDRAIGDLIGNPGSIPVGFTIQSWLVMQISITNV